MRSRFLAAALVGLSSFLTFGDSAGAQCRRVGPIDSIAIDDGALQRLGRIGIDRNMIFESIADVSIPETNGCWAGAAGNFDSQIVSLGVLQWNYGQNSLQPLMRRWKEKQSASGQLRSRLSELMPQHGELIFSDGCLRQPITAECKDRILANQIGGGALTPTLKKELDALFESNSMIQVQLDYFVRLLEAVQDDLSRLFDGHPTVRQIKWAIDMKVNQGSFPKDPNIKRMREKLAKASADSRKKALLSLVQWYEGHCNSMDQDGIRFDCAYNIEKWRQKFASGAVSSEQLDLLHLTFLKSRTAQGEEGRWQALTFQRRTQIILGCGSIGGRRMCQ